MDNTSGIYPSGDRILVIPEQIEQVTEGGIVIPDTIREHHGQAQTSGYLVAAGTDSWDDYVQPFAGIGDRVMFAKYGGQSCIGKDGKEYRVLNDVDITAIIDEEVTFNDIETRKSFN